MVGRRRGAVVIPTAQRSTFVPQRRSGEGTSSRSVIRRETGRSATQSRQTRQADGVVSGWASWRQAETASPLPADDGFEEELTGSPKYQHVALARRGVTER